MQCITVTGECAENVSVIETYVFMCVVTAGIVLAGLRHIVNWETTQRLRETVNERLLSTRPTVKLMAGWGEML